MLLFRTIVHQASSLVYIGHSEHNLTLEAFISLKCLSMVAFFPAELHLLELQYQSELQYHITLDKEVSVSIKIFKGLD